MLRSGRGRSSALRRILAAMIYLLRHGDAERGDADDAARRLTAKGKRQAKAAGAGLAILGVEIDACLTSPKVRASDTASLACQALGIEPQESAALGGANFDPLELAAGYGEVILVGHEPQLSEHTRRLTGARVKLRKGGIAVIEDGTLVALFRPRDLLAIASGEPPARTPPR